jgi:caffeoyl-CoA O-methyltransferase
MRVAPGISRPRRYARPMIVTPAVRDYLDRTRPPADPLLAEMQAHGARERIPILDAQSGALLHVLARAIGARRIVEVGTAIGVSTLHLARGGAHVTSFEVDRERHEAARGYLQQAGLADHVDLRLEDAAAGLRSLEPPFDLAFVDGPKLSYDEHVERCLELLRPGGLLLVDNTLMGGSVAGAPGGWSGASVENQRELNARLLADERLCATVTAVGDGVAIAVLRS